MRRSHQPRPIDDVVDLLLQRELRLLQIEDLRDVRRQGDLCFGKPDGVQMRTHELFIGDVERRRTNDAGHHLIAPLEEVLVVRRLGGAIGHDDGGLPGTTGTAGALGIVRRRRRHVSQIDGIKRRDVDTKLHGRRTEQGRQKLL